MNAKENIMGTMPAWKLIRRLAVPTVIITLVMAVYNMADIFFIGKTNNVDMVNAIAVCMPAFTIVQAFGTLIGAGGCTAISVVLGRNERKKAKQISAFCFYFPLTLGVLLAVVGMIFTEQIVSMLGASQESHAYAMGYFRVLMLGCPVMLFSNAFVNILRADGSVKESMLANLSGTILNIILDPVFILLLNMGVEGAAIATVVGNALAAVIVLVTLKKKSTFSIRAKDLVFKRDITLKTLSLGVPLSIGTLLMSLSYMVLNNLLLDVHPNAQGAFGISRTIMLLSTMVQMGICMGVQPAVSYNYGKNNAKRVKELILKTGIVCVCFGLLVAIICIGFHSAILGAFIKVESILAYGMPILLGCFITAPVYAIYQCAVTFLQATERPMPSTIITALRQGGLLIPIMYLLYQLGGFHALVFCFAVADVVSAVVGAALLRNRIIKLKDRKGMTI